MNEEESLTRFGLNPSKAELPEIRRLLHVETKNERTSQGNGDTELMKLLCIQLFNEGLVDDVLLIWDAKTSSMDADASIDVQLLCGQGMRKTREFLQKQPSAEADAALQRLTVCEAAGDFDGFSPQQRAHEYARYYGGEPE